MDMRYFRIYDGIFNSECKSLIYHFSNSEKEFYENSLFKFEQHTLTSSLSSVVVGKLTTLASEYVRDTKISQYQFPDKFVVETPRIKRYFDETCAFNDHVDVRDLASSKRFLSFLVYLNDVNDGGETEFFTPSGSLFVKPIAGRVVVFPPLWTYPHKAHPVKSGEKFILSSYLHYV